MILDTTTRKLQILLAGAVATNQLEVTASWVDMTATATTGGSTVAVTNNTTAVDIVAAPAASTQRKVYAINVYNPDTAAATVNVRYNDNGTIYREVVISVPVNSTLQYTDTGGWSIIGGAGTSGLAGINAQTGTSYTPLLGDANFLITSSNASAQTITIPPNSSVAFPIGTPIYLQQLGAGIASFAAGSGVTINTPSTLACRVQYSTIGVVKTATNTWQSFGDMA